MSATVIDQKLIEVEMPIAFTAGWNQVAGVSVTGNLLAINPGEFFFRYTNPSWLLCDWGRVAAELLPAVESDEITIEQMVCDFVKANGRTSTDPAEVLATAHSVYAHMYRPEHLDNPELDFATPKTLTMLRELGTLMALNRVEMDGTISNASPAWMLCATARVVYDLDESEAQVLDELYHGTWFNESRRRESVLAHAALGGRLVHGCQGTPNMSGGCVVPFGADIDRFRKELSAMRGPWIERSLGDLA
ncbi:hypothetical protein Lfu02_73250 [Longispora fulva]|uniref:Uncharacterized protein n=1 Tax=Longispora fulva TaxID=619741 RepID=A0A8J7GCG3_9ACTN|nr:hypothetical protein [Longispora fulva]MBG6133912.1 hypothetical protein [Longispora fulva]GIG62953.1 hypothetical protein Lfu02_73250 [Longispora fulva]